MTLLTDAPAEKPSSHELRTPPPSDRRFPGRLAAATLALLFVVLSIYLLDRLSSILQPLFVACFILYALFPVKEWLKRRGLPSWLAYTLILGTVLLLLLTLGTLAYNNLYQLNPENLKEYEGKIDARLNGILNSVGLGTEEPIKVRELLPGQEGFSLPEGAVAKVSGTFFGFLVFAAVVIVYLFFLLLEMAELPLRVREAFGSDRANTALDIAQQINENVGHYISVIAFISLLQGGLSALVLGALGIDFWLLWGLLIAICNFVPYVGLIGVALPVLFAFVAIPNEPWRALTALALLASIQAVIDNFISPRLTGHKLGVSPLLVLLSLAFWGWLWGPVGLVLAVPLTVTVKIILEHIPGTKPIAVLMRDK
jgi:predicted PurR-regulated permease PerM